MAHPLPDRDILPPAYAEPARHAAILAVIDSHLRLTGRALVAGTAADPVLALWRAPLVVLAHGTGADPVFFFANRAALAAFETDVAAVLAMPSRLSAEPDRREERAAALARVTAHGFIDDYGGMRISARGRRFAIRGATVWTVTGPAVVSDRAPVGQAAAFAVPGHAAAVIDL